MNKRVIVLIILLIVLSSISVKANIMCNDGTYSPTCGDCHRGCCSHHGGCASNYNYYQNENRYQETYEVIEDEPSATINDTESEILTDSAVETIKDNENIDDKYNNETEDNSGLTAGDWGLAIGIGSLIYIISKVKSK